MFYNQKKALLKWIIGGLVTLQYFPPPKGSPGGSPSLPPVPRMMRNPGGFGFIKSNPSRHKNISRAPLPTPWGGDCPLHSDSRTAFLPINDCGTWGWNRWRDRNIRYTGI